MNGNKQQMDLKSGRISPIAWGQ